MSTETVTHGNEPDSIEPEHYKPMDWMTVSREGLAVAPDNGDITTSDHVATIDDEPLSDIIDVFDEPPYVSPLDAIDPSLARELDSLTNETNMLLVRSLAQRIAEDYGKYADGKPIETWSQIVAIRELIGMNGHNAEQQILVKSPETIQALLEQLGKFVRITEDANEKDRKRIEWNLGFIMVPFAAAYDDRLFDDSTVDTIVEYARLNAPDQGAATNVGLAIEIIGKSGDPNCLPTYLDFYQELTSLPDNNLGGYRTKSDLLRAYFMSHGLDDQRVQGFRHNIFPLVEQRDPEVENLGATNSWPVEYGGFGISDFTIHCLVSEINPRNIRDLMQAYREIPTSDFAKFEQNRKDAAELMGALWRGRDWIHDEVPGVHNVLVAMLDYYETRDTEDVRQEKQAAILNAIARTPARYHHIIGDYGIDLDNYELPVKKLVGETYGTSTRSEDTELAVDVLRRLVENTRQTTLEKPHTEDERLNSMLDELLVYPNELTGEVHVSWGQVGQIVSYANELLRARQGEIGMRPSMVRALAYIDRMATHAMRGISDKDWLELPFDPHFKEIVKFRDLTSSADKFDERSFETFWKHFTIIPNWPDGVQDAYKELSKRILNQVNKMAQGYNSNRYTSYMSESLWSGNLNHELIGLTDTRTSFKRYEGLS